MPKKNFIGVICVAIVAAILVEIIYPALLVGLGYFFGWVTKITIGNTLVNAINTSFGTEITKDILPWLGAALSWIGSFFYTPQVGTNFKSKKD